MKCHERRTTPPDSRMVTYRVSLLTNLLEEYTATAFSFLRTVPLKAAAIAILASLSGAVAANAQWPTIKAGYAVIDGMVVDFGNYTVGTNANDYNITLEASRMRAPTLL